MRSVALKNVELQKEIDLGRTLTPLERDLAKFESDWAAEKVIMSEADAKATIEAMKHADALMQQRDRVIEAGKAMVAAQAAQDKSTESVRQAVEKQAEANAVLGLSAAALHEHEQALIADKIATLQARAAVLALEETDLATKLGAEVEEWKKLRDLKQQAFDAKAAQDFLASAQQTFEGVAGGFADAMMGGIDSIKRYLKTQLESMLIKVPLQMVAQGLAGDATNALAQALGISQPGGPKAGLGNLLSSGRDIYNMVTGAGSSTVALGGVGSNLLTGGAGLDVGAGGAYSYAGDTSNIRSQLIAAEQQAAENPVQASDPWGTRFKDIVTNIGTFGAGVIAVVKTIDRVRTVVTNSRTTNADGTTTVALDNGLVITKDAQGNVIGTARPPVGTGQTTVTGKIVANLGDGTYSLTSPDGTRRVIKYDPSLSSASIFDTLAANPVHVTSTRPAIGSSTCPDALSSQSTISYLSFNAARCGM